MPRSELQPIMVAHDDRGASLMSPGTIYRHKKSGGLYRFLEVGRIEADLRVVVAYRSLADRSVWVRPIEEWVERFEVARDTVPLPCPFCGGEAKELTCPGGSFVQCQTCKASSNDSNAVESWNRRTARSQPEAAAGSDEDSAYELGKRDGYEEAVQEIDVRTGGDGEFYGSTIPGRGQDVQSMLEGIVERFEELNSRLQPAAAEAPSSAERVTPSEVEDLVERQRTKLAELAEFAEIPRGLFKEVIDLQLKIAHALASLSLRVRALEEAAIQANGFLKDRFLKDGAFIDGAAQLASNYLSEAIRARTALHGSEGGNAG